MIPLSVSWIEQHTGSRQKGDGSVHLGRTVPSRASVWVKTWKTKKKDTYLLLSFIICLLFVSIHILLRLSLCASERGSGGHLDLTELIGVPLPPSVSFASGYEGLPAYNFGPDANIGRLTKTFVPGSFYRDFAIIVTVMLKTWTFFGMEALKISTI